MLPIGRTTPASPSITTGLTSPGLRPRADLIGGPVAWSLCGQWSAGCDMHVNESKTRHTNLFLLQRAPAHRACRRLCPEDSPQYQQSINPLVSSGGRFGNVDEQLLALSSSATNCEGTRWWVPILISAIPRHHLDSSGSYQVCQDDHRTRF